MRYYVDAVKGSDERSGSNVGEAWRSLGRASAARLLPGDELLLRRGCVWNEELTIRGRGTPEQPISLGAYGEGPRPRISARETHAVSADEPISAWRISGLELTSTNDLNPTRKILGGTCGIFFRQEELCDGLMIDDCLIHDTSGPGIYLVATGPEKPVFRDVVIEHCTVHNASCGIQFLGDPVLAPGFFPDFHVSHCVVHDIGGDGIMPSCGLDGLVEHCTAYRTGLGVSSEDHSPVAIWYAWARNCIIQCCEAYDNRTGGRKADGGGFDLDGGCTNCIMQYNYSHDNQGAGYLICSWDPIGYPCTGSVCRYNLSVNDGLANDYASIYFYHNRDSVVHNNTCVVRGPYAVKFGTNWGSDGDNLIANNVFVCESPEDTAIVMSLLPPGPSRFRNNCYHHLHGDPRFVLAGEELRGVEAFAARVGGEGEIAGDPLFADVEADSFHLRPGSPCRGAGLRLPDMGARDYYGTQLASAGPVDIGCAALSRPIRRRTEPASP